MKKLMLGTALTVSVLIFSAPVFAASYVNQSDVDAANQVLDAVNAFSDNLGSSSSSTSDIDQAGTTAEQALDTFASHKFSTQLGEAYTAASAKLQGDDNALKADIQQIVSDVDASNQSAADSDLTTYNTDVDNFNSDLQAVDSAVASGNKTHATTARTVSALYIALFVATLALTIGTFIWTRVRRNLDPMLAKSQKKLVIATIWPLIGAAITLGTFYAASKKGGTYYIAYGPIVIGLVVYLRGLATYLQNRKSSGQIPGTSAQPYAVSPVVGGVAPNLNPVASVAPVTPVAPAAPAVPQPSAYPPVTQQAAVVQPTIPQGAPVQPQPVPGETPPTPHVG